MQVISSVKMHPKSEQMSSFPLPSAARGGSPRFTRQMSLLASRSRCPPAGFTMNASQLLHWSLVTQCPADRRTWRFLQESVLTTTLWSPFG